jgi:two-component system sensor histidine kinase VicK
MSNSTYLEMTERLAFPSFIFSLSNAQLVYCNPALLSLLNTDKENLTPNFIRQVIHEEDYEYARKTFADLQNDKLNDHIQIRILVDKKVKWIRVMASLINGEESEILIFGNAVDITGEVENRLVFEKYANKKDAILSILAHDLTGPLNIINMLTTSLRSSISNPADLKQIDSIIKINKQATALIRDLTEREFVETADIVLIKKRVNISQKLKDYLEEYQHSAADTKRRFDFKSAPDNILLSLDEPKFFQVMNNLITNALKFTREDGRITVSVEENADQVQFEVSDDGIGIPEELHDIIFDKFTEARRKGLQGEPTLGLGMYVVKNIIEWHIGKVWVNSEEGNGTTVYFKIPKD